METELAVTDSEVLEPSVYSTVTLMDFPSSADVTVQVEFVAPLMSDHVEPSDDDCQV